MNLEQAMKRLGRNVKKCRSDQRITQEEITRFGFNYRYFQKIEAGEVNVTLDTIVKLARALKCKISSLLD